MTTSDKRGNNCPSCGAPITGYKCEYCGRVFVAPSADNDPFVKAFEEGRTKPLWQPKVLCVLPGGIPLIDERGLFDSDDDANADD